VRSINSYRPQNQHPDGLIRYHERLAKEHREQVRVTVQAMHRRKMKPHEITVAAVVKESGVSSATIYRNDELFALIRHDTSWHDGASINRIEACRRKTERRQRAYGVRQDWRRGYVLRNTDVLTVARRPSYHEKNNEHVGRPAHNGLPGPS
jgi:hypothetical protein